jgi:hypothetical protein
MCVLRCKESGGGVHPHPERTVGRKGRGTKKEEAGRGGKARECCQRGASAPGARPSVARAGLFHSSNACSMEGIWPAWPIDRSVTGVWHACYRVHRHPPSAACARAGEGGEKGQEKLLCGQALPGKSSPERGGKQKGEWGRGAEKCSPVGRWPPGNSLPRRGRGKIPGWIVGTRYVGAGSSVTRRAGNSTRVRGFAPVIFRGSGGEKRREGKKGGGKRGRESPPKLGVPGPGENLYQARRGGFLRAGVTWQRDCAVLASGPHTRISGF